MKSNDFDRIAFVYDKLARFVFGRSITESQQFFLDKIPDHSEVLILGGGSGWILQELFEIKPSVEVCYIDASKKMMSLAKEKLHNDGRVQFIHGTENDIPNRVFNVVITNFYLDVFEEQSLKTVLQKIKKSLTPGAKWFAADFVNEKWWHRAMLKIMYTFFKVAAKIQADTLPRWRLAVEQMNGVKTHSKSFCGGFIEASVFQF